MTLQSWMAIFERFFSSSRFGELQWFLCQAEVVTAGLNGIGFWSTAMALTLFMVWEGLRLEKERLQSTMMPPPSWLRFESSKLDVFDWWSGEVDKSCLWLTHILEEIGKFFHLYSYKDLQTIITFRCSRVLVALSLFDPTSSPSGLLWLQILGIICSLFTAGCSKLSEAGCGKSYFTNQGEGEDEKRVVVLTKSNNNNNNDNDNNNNNKKKVDFAVSLHMYISFWSIHVCNEPKLSIY